jgi:hypothetical protein
MNISELKETIVALTLPDFEDLANFVFHQGKERNAGFKQFSESIGWKVDPKHDETVH